MLKRKSWNSNAHVIFRLQEMIELVHFVAVVEIIILVLNFATQYSSSPPLYNVIKVSSPYHPAV